MAVDWSKLGAPTVCPVEGCDHHLGLHFTARHRWSLTCGAGMWWTGCVDANWSANSGRDRCECAGCAPVKDQRLSMRNRTCRCSRRYGHERMIAEAEVAAERD